MAIDLTDYAALSFDCYGTLIDWEAGIAAVLGPWARRADPTTTDEQVLVRESMYDVARSSLTDSYRAGATSHQCFANTYRLLVSARRARTPK